MRSVLIASVIWVLAAGAAMADRPVTDQERARLSEAVAAQGCSGGRMEADDDEFEVNDAICADGKKYDLEFDQSFKMIEKELQGD